jgi:molybdopterin molybdotransferase
VRDKFFFGLPGNPASTMVTFELFARAAIALLGGEMQADLPLMAAPLTRDFRHKTGLTRFLPATICFASAGPQLTPIGWRGSGDVPALTRANAFLVADEDRAQWKAGEWMRVLMK